MARKVIISVGVALALAAAAITLGFLASRGGHSATDTAAPFRRPGARKTYAQLVAGNYKVLKPRQLGRLLRYANAAYACMSKQLDLGKPRASRKRIVMAVPPGAGGSMVASVGASCARKIGDPPRNASFQVRRHAIVLYMPRYCIPDKSSGKTTPLPSS